MNIVEKNYYYSLQIKSSCQRTELHPINFALTVTYEVRLNYQCLQWEVKDPEQRFQHMCCGCVRIIDTKKLYVAGRIA